MPEWHVFDKKGASTGDGDPIHSAGHDGSTAHPRSETAADSTTEMEPDCDHGPTKSTSKQASAVGHTSSQSTGHPVGQSIDQLDDGAPAQTSVLHSSSGS